MTVAIWAALLAFQASPHSASTTKRELSPAFQNVSEVPLPTQRTQHKLTAIPVGTMIELVLAETISTRTHVKGDTFELNVSKPLLVDGLEVLPIGGKVIGEVTRAQTKSAFGVSGKLEARLLYAILPAGTVRLNGKLAARGEGGTTETVLTYAAIGAIAFVVTGKSAVIKKGTEWVGVIQPR